MACGRPVKKVPSLWVKTFSVGRRDKSSDTEEEMRGGESRLSLTKTFALSRGHFSFLVLTGHMVVVLVKGKEWVGSY